MRSHDIHWFPGHMAKALREIETKIKHVDVVIELLDARAPASSLNPFLNKISPQKPRIFILTKKDLADLNLAKKWQKVYQQGEHQALLLALNDRSSRSAIIKAIAPYQVAKNNKGALRGLKPQPLRALVVGIPNVGKSTLINLLVGRRSAPVANRPGLTRGQQWVKVSPELELIDTPGVLPPNYEDKRVALRLSMLGTLPETILPENDIQQAIIIFLKNNYPQYLLEKYDLQPSQLIEPTDILLGIAKRRGLMYLGEYNLEDAGRVLQKEFRVGQLGRIGLDEIDNA